MAIAEAKIGNTTPKSAQLTPGPGFRIRTTISRPPGEVVERLGRFPTPSISDSLNRLYTACSAIHDVSENGTLYGPACTVKVFPGDNLMVHKSLDILMPGDVVVIDAGGSSMNGVLGDLISTKAKHRGAAGFIVDGLIRDLPEVKATGLPVFARGVTPIGPLHRGPGEINFPITCGGIVVNPGDIICADSNGVVVVQQNHAEELLAQLEGQKDRLTAYEEAVARGEFSNEWVDAKLDEAGCLILE